MPRLLQCMDCLTLEKLPDYDGHPDDDVLLEGLVERHRFPNGEPHNGNLLRVDEKTWASLDARKAIEREVWKEKAEFAATRDTYEEDAQICFSKHGRPKEGCIDYFDERKRIGNPTKEGWKTGRIKVYLCQFCPVHSWVTTQRRAKRGMYKG